MSEQPSRESLFEDLGRLISDHLRLAVLESRFELGRLLRAGAFVTGALVLLTAAFALITAGLVKALAALGVPVIASCFIFGALYGLGAYALVRQAMRPSGVGEPFSGTIEQMERTIRWIQTAFFANGRR